MAARDPDHISIEVFIPETNTLVFMNMRVEYKVHRTYTHSMKQSLREG